MKHLFFDTFAKGAREARLRVQSQTTRGRAVRAPVVRGILQRFHFTNRAVRSVAGLALVTVAAMSAHGSMIPISFNANGGGDYTASGSSLSQVIPDNNPSGVGYDLNFGFTGLAVANVTVSLNISGGQNGDLYAYLANPNGSVLYLLDRVGVSSGSTYGNSTAGMNVTLSDGGTANIHSYVSDGTYKADGATTSPLDSTPADFNANGGALTFASQFVGSGNNDPNGDWTLFFADASGGSVSTLNSFNVDITANVVPEPVNEALGIFGGLIGMVALARSKRVKRLLLEKLKS
jgi:subtilisin-like proprotein convertase family protein